MKDHGKMYVSSLLLALYLLVGAGTAAGDVYRVNQRSQWQEWQFPSGTLELRTDGSVIPVKFEGSLNAALDAPQYSHDTKKSGEVQGGVWKVGSNPEAAGNIIDGNPDTWWKPDPTDALEKWWVEIDLGRSIPVTRVRLVFPDEEGARPFQEFRVFGSDGQRIGSGGQDLFSFHLIGGTTRANEQTAVEYQAKPLGLEATLTSEDLPTLSAENGASVADRLPAEVSSSLLQYIRVRADGRSSDAALSEVEVHTFGENIALGTIERGGNLVERSGRGSALVDGDPNSSWGYASYPTRLDVTWKWDLGAVFWIDRIIAVAQRGSDLYNNRIWASDGRQTLTGELDYDLLFDWYPLQSRPVQLTYVLSSPRALRHLHAQFEEVSEGHYNTGKFAELAVFSTGHVAQVEMVSGFIDLGRIAQDDRPKVISSLSWDAELPAGTRVQARTRSGNTLVDRILYFHKDGTQLTRAQYDDLIKPLKGEQDTLIDVGEDWSVWSGLYQGSGDGFLSPSPRRYVQIRVLLSSDRPAVAPTLRSISLDYENALVAGIKGEVAPREARPGIPQTFTYRLLPEFGAGDDGFDRILLLLPSRVDLDSLGVRIGGTEVEPTSVRISGSSDSLVVELPQVVRQEGVEMEIRLSLIRNGTLLRAFVNHTGKDVPWQSVDPAERFATTVFLPTVPQTTRLIADLAVVPPVITPNGDGVGDQAEIRFSVLKVDKPATVRIYGLNGPLIRELEGELGPDLIWRYRWSGRDESGALVPPGIYLSQTKLETQPGEETRTRTIGVAY